MSNIKWLSERKNILSNFRKIGEGYETSVGRILVEQIGGSFKTSTFKQNTVEHIDILWTDQDGCEHGIDVKMPKKTRRYDSEPDNSRTWIEILNINGGPGWIDGSEEWIAFVRDGNFNDILFANRAKLSSFVKKRIETSRIYEYNTGRNYDLYTRRKWGNDDLCTIVPFEDIEPFVDFKLKFKK